MSLRTISPNSRKLIAAKSVIRSAEDIRPTPGAVLVSGTRVLSTHPLDDGAGYKESLNRLVSSLDSGLATELEVDDLGERLLTPAFVDAHTHLGLSVLRGTQIEGRSEGNVVEDIFYAFESHLTPEDVRAFVRVGAYEALITGTGMVWDHYFFGDAVKAALLDVGLSGVVAPTLQELGGPGVGRVEEEIEATLRLHEASRGAGERVWAALGPHASDTVSERLWRRVASLAERHDLPVHAHLAQSIEEVRRVFARDGVSPGELIVRSGVLEAAPSSLLVHGLFLCRSDLEKIERSSAGRARLGFCPRSQQIFGFAADPELWEDSGLDWVLATDCAASNDATSIPRELTVLGALESKQVVKSEAFEGFFAAVGDDAKLRAEELQAARQASHSQALERRAPATMLAHVWDIPGSLHPDFRAGVIEAGALANLVAWDVTHPVFWPARDLSSALVRSSVELAIDHVMVAGEWLGERSDFARSLVASVEYRDALEEAQSRRAAIMARLG